MKRRLCHRRWSGTGFWVSITTTVQRTSPEVISAVLGGGRQSRLFCCVCQARDPGTMSPATTRPTVATPGTDVIACDIMSTASKEQLHLAGGISSINVVTARHGREVVVWHVCGDSDGHSLCFSSWHCQRCSAISIFVFSVFWRSVIY